MKGLMFVVATMLMLSSGGCCWPAATLISGDAEVVFTTAGPAWLTPASQPRSPRMVVVRYWRYQELFGPNEYKYDYLSAKLVDEAKFKVGFPLRFYSAVWTPALGTQHLLPDAGLIVFTADFWPAAVLAGDGRRCCEAPTTGTRHWCIALRPISEIPVDPAAAKAGAYCEFPPIDAEQLENLLKRAGDLTDEDRAMCREQLSRLSKNRRTRPAQ